MKKIVDIGQFQPGSRTGQFTLSRDPKIIPDHWSMHEKAGWYLGVNGLPVMPVVDVRGSSRGYCLGYPVAADGLCSERVTLTGSSTVSTEPESIEAFYADTGGRFVLVLLEENSQKVYLDPYGSLGVVFSVQQETVASTLTLVPGDIDWDVDLIDTLNMPASGFWIPSGLTARKSVSRLLPNHVLDLEHWTVERHWPLRPSDLAVNEQVDKGVAAIADSIKHTIGSVTEHYPVHMSLTAGRDARMLLACARDYLSRVLFVTIAGPQDTVDTCIAARLAKKFGLEHRRVPVQLASDDELIQWLDITGYALGGEIWKIHKSLQGFDRHRVMLPGIAGEVGRAFYWRDGDSAVSKLSAEILMQRAGLPVNDGILQATTDWLDGLSEYNAYQILDLFYLEQRLGCWAGPQHYGNTTSVFELSPFNHRRIFTAMMQLPYQYRLDQQLANDVCRQRWPALLKYPVNRYTSWDRLRKKTIDSCHRTCSGIVSIMRTVNPQ
jgi:hypothetical protein